MYKQIEMLRSAVTAILGQTYTVDLPKSGTLSAIQLHLSANCTSNAGLTLPKWRLIDFITKVEVIGNGATVIKSLDGKQLQYLFFKHMNKVPPHFWRQYGESTQMEYIPILFGRDFFDESFGLDLSKWDNVELRITNDGSATYYSTDITLSIVLNWVRELAGGFNGYIRGETWREWATVQNAWTYLIMPSEFPIVTLALRALPHVTGGMSDTGFHNLMYDIEFSMGGGVKKLYDGRLADLIIQNYLDEDGEVFTSGETYANADLGQDTAVGRMFGWAAVGGSKSGGVMTTFPSMIADATDNTISFEAHDTVGPWEWIVRGMAYWNMATLWFAHDLSVDKLLDPKVVGDVLLNLHVRDAAASAAGTNTVVLERLVSR